MDGELFLARVKQRLVLCLKPGDVVVTDNLATHKVAGLREAIEGAGAWLEYLPPYSPDLNPIEPMWSKVKQSLKSRNHEMSANCKRPPAPLSRPSYPPTAKDSFYTPDTLHDLWKRSRVLQIGLTE